MVITVATRGVCKTSLYFLFLAVYFDFFLQVRKMFIHQPGCAAKQKYIQRGKISFNTSFLGEERSVSCKIWLTGEKGCLLVDVETNCTAWNNNIIFGKNLEMMKKCVLQNPGSDI